MRRRRFAASALTLPFALVAAPATAQAPLQNLRVAATPNDTYAEAYYALDMGFFRRAGLNVELTTLNNGAAVSSAVASGAIDVGVSTPVQLANAILRGVPFAIVAAGAMNTKQVPAGLVCVAKDSNIRTAKDLEGKTVALNALRTLGEAALDVWLVKGGADVAKIRTVEMTFSEMGPAIERGTVAAGSISEPALSVTLATNNARSLGDPYGAISPNFLISSWFTTVGFAQQHPDLVKKFSSAIYATARWANTHHDDSGTVLAKYTKMNVDVIHKMMRAPYAEALRLQDIQSQLDIALKYGLLPKAVSAGDLIAR
jgi:NitT/TauT family transport system substrate-binding protein